jgi:hypothetical protein
MDDSRASGTSSCGDDFEREQGLMGCLKKGLIREAMI